MGRAPARNTQPAALLCTYSIKQDRYKIWTIKCVYNFLYIYIYFSLLNTPRPLLTSNVDYLPQLWRPQLPLHPASALRAQLTQAPRARTGTTVGQTASHLPSVRPSVLHTRRPLPLLPAQRAPCQGWGASQLAGVSLGGGLEPGGVGRVAGSSLQLPQHFPGGREGEAHAQQRRERRPSKGHQGPGPRGGRAVATAGSDEAPRLPSACPLCTAFQPSARHLPGHTPHLPPGILPPHPAAGTRRSPAPLTGTYSTQNCSPSPPAPGPAPGSTSPGLGVGTSLITPMDVHVPSTWTCDRLQ